MMDVLPLTANDFEIGEMEAPPTIETQFEFATTAHTMERPDSAAATHAAPPDDCSPLAAAQLKCDLSSAATEPLKVCLDDDSSIEDGDEDMFDDDAFAFGDEDFQALMSHESMRRSVKSQLHDRGARPAAPSSAAVAGSASPLPEKAASAGTLVSVDSSSGGGDSMPSTAASSLASLGTLTLASQASCTSMSKKTKSKRRVSLHNDVAVIPIPSREEYPAAIRERIWSSAGELWQNAVRNTVEFAAEGFDWRNAADDAQMVRSPLGERIHPVHYMHVGNFGPASLDFDRELRPCQHQAEVGAAPIGMDVESVPS